MPTSAQFEQAKEHAASQRTIDLEGAQPSDLPNFMPDFVKDQLPQLQLVRDVMGGTDVLRAKRTEYLPKHAAEDDDDYEKRVARAILFNATEATVHGLVGMVMRKDPSIDAGVPTKRRLREMLDNVDLRGRNVAMFARDLGDDAMADGHAVIHVDVQSMPTFTKPDGTPRKPTRQEEGVAGLRAFWVEVPKADIVNVQWEMRGGAPFLTLFVYREQVMRPVGAFGVQTIERFRVLRPGWYEVWEKQERETDGVKKSIWVQTEGGPVSLSYIPVTAAYSKRLGEYQSKPPLHDLAHENIGHYRNRNEDEMSLARARIPMPVFRGVKKEDVMWGAGFAVFLPRGDAGEVGAEMLESTGAALQASRDDLKERESRMAVLGLQMLIRETRSAETAEGKRIDSGEKESKLSKFAGSLEVALNEALRFTADFMKVKLPAGTMIKVNRDFHAQEISPQMVQVLQAMVKEGNLSIETFWEIIERGEVLPDSFNAEQELKRILDGMMRKIKADREAQAMGDAPDLEGEQGGGGGQQQNGGAQGDMMQQQRGADVGS